MSNGEHEIRTPKGLRIGNRSVVDGAQFQTGCSNILVQRRTGTCGANSMYIRSLSGQ